MRGTRCRSLHNPSLIDLEREIENLPFKVLITQWTHKPNGEWYVHFNIEDNVVYSIQNDVPSITESEKLSNKKGSKK